MQAWLLEMVEGYRLGGCLFALQRAPMPRSNTLMTWKEAKVVIPQARFALKQWFGFSLLARSACPSQIRSYQLRD
jgi:hypothetical protein